MGIKQFGKLALDPAKNPAVLDTETWDPENAIRLLSSVDVAYWQRLVESLVNRGGITVHGEVVVYPSSLCGYQGRNYLLVGLRDGQRVFLETGEPSGTLGLPLWTLSDRSVTVSAYDTSADRIDAYCREIDPEKGPRCLGTAPRLGIGSRMTRAVWPGVWEAMAGCGFSANAIQNSLRELNLLDELLAGKPPKINYLFGFGNIQEGHTGSTFEGLWTSGVLEALAANGYPRYGADADHISVKREPGGIDRAKKVIHAARHYTFYTIDVSDILNYEALHIASDAEASELLAKVVTDPETRGDLVLFHARKRRFGNYCHEIGEGNIGRLVGKYWLALNALEELHVHLTGLKGKQPFDLELSIDETPPEVKAFDAITTDQELLFLILEASRRNIRLTHLAPNLGVEKGVDYRGPDGLNGLFTRLRRLYDIASEYDLMIDCHSGDFLGQPTRRAIGRATNGRNQFKISPVLQLMFAEVLSEFHPEVFRFWWDDTLAYAQREAEGGSPFAVRCLKEYASAGSLAPAPHHPVFEHFHFATIGRRNSQGQFLNREIFYSLMSDFYREYQKRVVAYLCQLADDLLNY